MLKKFTQRAKNSILNAQTEAKELGHPAIGTEHVLLGILREGEGIAARALNSVGVTLTTAREAVMNMVGAKAIPPQAVPDELPITPRVKRVLFTLALDEATQQGVNYVGTEHLLLGLLAEADGLANTILRNLNVNLDELRAQVFSLLGGNVPESAEPADKRSAGGKPSSFKIRTARREKSHTPTLDSYSRDLIKDAQTGHLDPVIGRDTEIERVIQTLSRRTKNNPVLIGEPGVGKTAIVEGLAERISGNTVPETLTQKRVMMLDLAAMIAGTKYRGEFEDRLNKIINEIKRAGDVIIVIDELHTIIGAGAAEGAIDAANILKPALARGELQCIGATTLDEYRKYIEKDAALERRFQPILVEEPTQEESVQILKGLRDRYEAHHGVKISDEALDAAVRLSARYINDRFLPDKAIDLIDEASSRVNLSSYVLPDELKEKKALLEETRIEKEAAINQQEYEKAACLRDEEKKVKAEIEVLRDDWTSRRTKTPKTVTQEDIATIISSWSGIPLSKIETTESQKLLQLEEILHQRVIGQEEAVTSVAKAVRRARAGLKNPKRPIGSFIFLGPTGVGKTELARALAEAIFGSEEAMVRLDMSEYMEKHAVARMIGSPPGYVGYDEGGQLTEKIRRHPYSVVLLDEIEKAHEDVFNILLQVLEDGRMTDGQGRTVDFSNTIVIMTSNVGASGLPGTRTLGFTQSNEVESRYQDLKDRLRQQMKTSFKPEFLNRIDEIVVFHALTDADLQAIVEVLLAQLSAQIVESGYRLKVAEPAKALVLKHGYNQEYGARPLRRAIQNLLTDAISEEILKGVITPGDTIIADAHDDQITISKKLPLEDDNHTPSE